MQNSMSDGTNRKTENKKLKQTKNKDYYINRNKDKKQY